MKKLLLSAEGVTGDIVGRKSRLEMHYGDARDPVSIEGIVSAVLGDGFYAVEFPDGVDGLTPENSTDAYLSVDGVTHGSMVTNLDIVDDDSPIMLANTSDTPQNRGALSGQFNLSPILINVNWQQTFGLGKGVDYLTGLVKPPAVEPFDVEESKQQRDEEIYEMITNERSFQREIEVSIGGSGSIEGIDLGASLEYVNRLEYSETSMTVVAKYQRRSALYADAPNPKLTDEARQLMVSSPDEFRERYGDYFISGYAGGASFYAVYNCYSTKSSNMNQFKASVSAGITGLFSVKGAEAFKLAAQKSNVSIRVYISRYGYTGSPPSDPVDPAMIPAALDWFKQHVSLVPMKTKLTHFSVLEPSYPTGVGVAARNIDALNDLYAKYWQVLGKYDSCPQYYRNQLESAFRSLQSGMAKDQTVLATDLALVGKYAAKAGELLDKLNGVMARYAFYLKIKELVYLEPPKDRKMEDGNGNISWSYGMPSSQDTLVKIQTTREKYDVKFKPAGWREHTFTFGPNPKRLIVGWRVIANWTDGTDGWWKKASDQILLKDESRVFVKSEYSRGCSWTVEVAYVDAADYQF